MYHNTFEIFMAWIKTLVKCPEKCPITVAALGRSTERVKTLASTRILLAL
jgi:hypothetical protein